MTEKELIKQEIEKELSVLGRTSDFDYGRYAELNHLLLFISKLQKEPASEDLEKEIEHYINLLDEKYGLWEGFKNIIKEAVVFGAEWQKKKDEQHYEDELDRCACNSFNKGYKSCQQQMMENSMEADVVVDRLGEVTYLCPHTTEKYGDKVKLVIIKDENNNQP